MRKLLAPAVLAAALSLGAAAPAKAGPLLPWWGRPDRGVEVGAVVPYGGAPFSHRYNFYAGPSFYIGGDYNHFEYMDYLDRLDRAEKFGYRIPDPPAFLNARPCGR